MGLAIVRRDCCWEDELVNVLQVVSVRNVDVGGVMDVVSGGRLLDGGCRGGGGGGGGADAGADGGGEGVVTACILLWCN